MKKQTYKGKVLTKFKIRDKVYNVGDEYSCSNLEYFNHLLNIKRIDKK